MLFVSGRCLDILLKMHILLAGIAAFCAYFIIKRRLFVRRFDKLPGSPVTLGIIGDLAALATTFKRCGSVTVGLADYLTSVTLFNTTSNRKNGGIWTLWVGPKPFVVVSDPQLVEQVLTSNTLTRKSATYNLFHQWLGTGLLTSYGAKWHEHRKLLTPSFHFKILESFTPVMNENAKILVNILKEQADRCDNVISDLRKPILHCALDIICETAMGKRVNAQSDPDGLYIKAIYEISEMIVERNLTIGMDNDFIYSLTARGHAYRRHLATINSFTKHVMEERMSQFAAGQIEEETDDGVKKREPFLDTLIKEHLKRPKKFTIENIREEVETFMFEGHDTTAWGVIWAVFLLGLHPQEQEKVQCEIDALFDTKDSADDDLSLDDLRNLPYIEAVIKESQRLYPSVPAIMRACDNDTQIGEFTLPAGCEITVPIFRIHRDKTHWKDGERFKPERFVDTNTHRHPFSYIPFSAGPRNCIGQKFALLEEKALLARIFQHFNVSSLNLQCDLTPSVSLISKSLQPVRVKLTSRKL